MSNSGNNYNSSKIVKLMESKDTLIFSDLIGNGKFDDVINMVKKINKKDKKKKKHKKSDIKDNKDNLTSQNGNNEERAIYEKGLNIEKEKNNSVKLNKINGKELKAESNQKLRITDNSKSLISEGNLNKKETHKNSFNETSQAVLLDDKEDIENDFKDINNSVKEKYNRDKERDRDTMRFTMNDNKDNILIYGDNRLTNELDLSNIHIALEKGIMNFKEKQSENENITKDGYLKQIKDYSNIYYKSELDIIEEEEKSKYNIKSINNTNANINVDSRNNIAKSIDNDKLNDNSINNHINQGERKNMKKISSKYIRYNPMSEEENYDKSDTSALKNFKNLSPLISNRKSDINCNNNYESGWEDIDFNITNERSDMKSNNNNDRYIDNQMSDIKEEDYEKYCLNDNKYNIYNKSKTQAVNKLDSNTIYNFDHIDNNFDISLINNKQLSSFKMEKTDRLDKNENKNILSTQNNNNDNNKHDICSTYNVDQHNYLNNHNFENNNLDLKRNIMSQQLSKSKLREVKSSVIKKCKNKSSLAALTGLHDFIQINENKEDDELMNNDYLKRKNSNNDEPRNSTYYKKNPNVGNKWALEVLENVENNKNIIKKPLHHQYQLPTPLVYQSKNKTDVYCFNRKKNNELRIKNKSTVNTDLYYNKNLEDDEDNGDIHTDRIKENYNTHKIKKNINNTEFSNDINGNLKHFNNNMLKIETPVKYDSNMNLNIDNDNITEYIYIGGKQVKAANDKKEGFFSQLFKNFKCGY